eukprot:15453354-Alexandrium_andersonii.AAC.1
MRGREERGQHARGTRQNARDERRRRSPEPSLLSVSSEERGRLAAKRSRGGPRPPLREAQARAEGGAPSAEEEADSAAFGPPPAEVPVAPGGEGKAPARVAVSWEARLPGQGCLSPAAGPFPGARLPGSQEPLPRPT